MTDDVFVGETTEGRKPHRGAPTAWIWIGLVWLALGIWRLVSDFTRDNPLSGLGVGQIALGAFMLLYALVLRRRERRQGR